MAAEFSGLSVLVTGAASGFGAETARQLAAQGARLVISDLNADGLESVRAGLAAGGVECRALAGDVAEPRLSHDLVAEAVAAFGRLDIAINNAGIAHPQGRIPQIDEATARKVVAVDLLGVFWALQAQLPQMEAQYRATGRGGAIVNTASVAGLVGAPTLSIYAAAKHGVVGLTRTAATEYARRGIRVNAVCPSFARTPMAEDPLRDAPDRAEAEAQLVRGVPMRRLAEVGEVVQAILWAASPANSFMTGQALAIDGGITAY
ncbi:MAG: glucose 1-dehydrogenase [Alphaproteobacteria bacterium]|nr:MAG: glucose 1-dehydrogenase [Alphaproteobacteria bacterium]